MRAPSLAPAALLLLAGAAAAGLEIVELRNGRVIEAKSVSVKGDKLHIELSMSHAAQKASVALPFDKIVPEFVYYAWDAQTDADDVGEHLRIAAWARKNGLFRHAWRTYGLVAAQDSAFEAKLAEFKAAMREEEATWNFSEAWRLFRADEVKAARLRAERVVADFPESKEVGRAKDLLNIIQEREQFLSEQKKQKEIAARARKQRRQVDRLLQQVERANRQVAKASFRYPSHAERRLAWAGYTYRNVGAALTELFLIAEVDDLRLTLKALIEDLNLRLVGTFVKLGDLRFLTGDTPGALEAAHEVLAIDPANRRASDLRDRVLDGAGAGGAPRLVDPRDRREPIPTFGITSIRPRYIYTSFPGGYERYRPGYHAGVGIYVLPSRTTYRHSYGGYFGFRRYRFGR